MITDTTAQRLAHDLLAYRQMLSVALQLVASMQQSLDARERAIIGLRDELSRMTERQVQA